ncbi:hypothetical protein EDD29_0407 [Actinocorallia herbida]|uniref:Uncharacterized protein n=1 Tax=Actinocorallia herbida TaxID=58109 RepID=A0A3N1CNQ3_9ACTN|nr:hypothetical protein EDD29_0407 [Actinocorallia herbida]
MKSILKGLTYPRHRSKQLHDVRDGVVPVGLLDEAEARETLTAYLRLCNVIYDELNIAKEARWKSQEDYVESLISETLTAIRNGRR